MFKFSIAVDSFLESGFWYHLFLGKWYLYESKGGIKIEDFSKKEGKISRNQYFDGLKNLSVDNVNDIFSKIVSDLQEYLYLEPVIHKVKIILLDHFSLEIEESKKIFNYGVRRRYENGILFIEVLNADIYTKFLPFIVLREVYNCFVPNKIKQYESIQLIINQIIVANLSDFTLVNEWKTLIRERIADSDSISSGYGRLFDYDLLYKYFKLQGIEPSSNPILKFFFGYIRRFSSLISNEREAIDDLLEALLFNYLLLTTRMMQNDDVVETIRCIIRIFWEVKSYRSLYDYENHFKEFKETGRIETDLSQRKFVNNMRLIKNLKVVAPSYQINWNAVNVYILVVFLRFNPILKKEKVYKVVENFPFFTTPKFSRTSFFIDVSGYFLVPKAYLKDLKGFFRKLENFGYIIKKHCVLVDKFHFFLNLNYFRELYKNKKIVNPYDKNYENKYEVELELDYGKNLSEPDLSLFDFLLIDRIRWFSIYGFGFERRSETLGLIKSDFFNDLTEHRAKIAEIRANLNKFHTLPELKSEFLQFLNNNQKFNFFFIKDILNKIVRNLNKLKTIISENPRVKNTFQLQELIFGKKKILQTIEDIQTFSDTNVNRILFKNLIPMYFKSKRLFNKEINKYQNFYDVFKSCFDLKIYNVNFLKQLISSQPSAEKVYKIKEDKFKKIFTRSKSFKITNQIIDDSIEKLLNNKPPIIKPNLIGTVFIPSLENFFTLLILKNTQETRELLKKLKVFFHKVFIYNTSDLFSEENLIFMEIYLPNLNSSEKERLFSILYNTLKKNLLYFKPYSWSGGSTIFSIKNFYDLTIKKYYYTEDLINHLFLYVQNILGQPLTPQKEVPNEFHRNLWDKSVKMEDFVKAMKKQNLQESIRLPVKELNELLQFHLNLSDYLLEPEKLNEIKEKRFYKQYIRAIKFKPNFRQFGLGEYYFYFHTSKEPDFKALLSNTFQTIKYPACIDKSNSFFVKMLFPYLNPNTSYIKRFKKKIKSMREYCLFSIKTLHQVLHFDYNLSSEGWALDPKMFKVYMQKVLFDPDYKIHRPHIKEFNINGFTGSNFNGLGSAIFEKLSKIYNWHSSDFRFFVNLKLFSTIKIVQELVKKDLIFPYLKLKNIHLQEVIYVILPDLKRELNNTIVKAFSFFNLAFIYEIEGEYFIDGFPDIVKFENGLMIKLYLPSCKNNELLKSFDLMFELLKIEHYLILTDLVDGTTLLKSIYGNVDFLKKYNPLKNLRWNSKDKRWMNHKLYTQKYEPIYPDLFFGESGLDHKN